MGTFGKEDYDWVTGKIFGYESGTVRRQAPENGVITSLHIYVGAIVEGEEVRLCVFDDDGGYPNNVLEESGSTPVVANSWNEIAGFNVEIILDNWYWFGVQQKESGSSLGGENVGATKYKAHVYGPYTNPFPVGASSGGFEYSIYATYTPPVSGGAGGKKRTLELIL